MAGTNITNFVGSPDSMDSIKRFLVADMAAQRVAGVGRIGNNAAVTNNFDNGLHEPRLRIDRVDFNHLGHARIVGDTRGRA